MENKKDIGKAISEKLNSLDKTPRENVWNGISYELQKKKKRRFVFFFFWTKTIGLLLIGAVAAWYVYDQNGGSDSVSPNGAKESIIVNSNGENSNKENTYTNAIQSVENNTNEAVGENDSDSKNSLEGKYSVDKNNANTNSNSVKGKNKNASGKSNKINSSKTNYLKATKKIRGKTKQSGVKPTQLSKIGTKKSTKKSKGKEETEKQITGLNDAHSNQNNTALFDPTALQNKTSIDQSKEVNTKKTDSLMAKKEKEKKKRPETKPEDKKEKDSTVTKEGYKKFSVDAFVSPTHYGYFSNNSTLGKALNSNPTSSNIETNYGFGLTYQLTEKVSIRIGYTRVKLNYTTKNARVDTLNYTGIKYNTGASNEYIYAASNGGTRMDLTQKFTYNEIPLEARYRFLDNKFGMNAIVGFSFILLKDNTVSAKTNNGGFNQNIGQTKGLFDTSVSANIGFGLDYEIFKNTKVMLEPTLNYQAISFENSAYKPYYFGLHFGLRYALIDK